MAFHPRVAPVKVAVLPLSKKENLLAVSNKVFADLSKDWLTQHDDAGSIGKRYRRQDEIGTPLCVTVDFQSLEDQQVTVRHRDSMKQDRIAVSNVREYLEDKFNEEQ